MAGDCDDSKWLKNKFAQAGRNDVYLDSSDRERAFKFFASHGQEDNARTVNRIGNGSFDAASWYSAVDQTEKTRVRRENERESAGLR